MQVAFRTTYLLKFNPSIEDLRRLILLCVRFDLAILFD